MKKKMLCIILILASFNSKKVFANYLEFSIGGLASRGLIGIGYTKEKNYFGAGIGKPPGLFGDSYIIPFVISYERRVLINHTPFISLQYVPSYTSMEPFVKGFGGRKYKNGFNIGLISCSSGYQFDFHSWFLQLEISADTPLTSEYAKDIQLHWGVGVSIPWNRTN